MKHRKKSKLMFALLMTLFVMSSILTITFAYLFSSFKETVDKSSSISYVSELRKSSLKIESSNTKDPVGILLMGVDSSQKRDPSEGARSDTLIYVTINPHSKKIKAYSISRDLYAWVDDNYYTKINAAFSIGQEVQASKAVEKFLDAPVDYFVSVNMDALVDIVDSIGGIEVNNTLGFPISISDTEPLYTSVVNPGIQHVNGDQALVYSRMRYQDPEGDVGRQKRQREVIMSIISKLKSGSILTSYNKILNVVKDNIKTSITFDDIPSMITTYSDSLQNVEMSSIVGRGEMINDIYFMIAGKNNLLEIRNDIRQQLGLKPVYSIDDPNLILVDDSLLELDPSTHYDFQ